MCVSLIETVEFVSSDMLAHHSLIHFRARLLATVTDKGTQLRRLNVFESVNQFLQCYFFQTLLTENSISICEFVHMHVCMSYRTVLSQVSFNCLHGYNLF